jgi:hypothetical protein
MNQLNSEPRNSHVAQFSILLYIPTIV